VVTVSYDYIKRTYTFQPQVGKRVRHTVTGKLGTISQEGSSQGHYVQVRFDDCKFPRPCHPGELSYDLSAHA
jgi:hypothetical protein